MNSTETTIGPNGRTYETSLLWVCIDCMVLHANGDMPTEPTDREPLNLIGATDTVTAGMLTEHHATGCTESDRESGDCECETISFSWSDCSGCGSPLGGSRHALTVWIGSETGYRA